MAFSTWNGLPARFWTGDRLREAHVFVHCTFLGLGDYGITTIEKFNRTDHAGAALFISRVVHFSASKSKMLWYQKRNRSFAPPSRHNLISALP